MRLCLVEDIAVAGLEPLALTRPAYDLRLGAGTIGDKIRRAFRFDPQSPGRGVVVRPHLAKVLKSRDPYLAVNDRTWLSQDSTLVVNARWVPPAGFVTPPHGQHCVGLCEGQVAYAFVGPNLAGGLEPHTMDSWFQDIADKLEKHDVGGDWIARPWDIVAKNSAHLERDFLEAGKVGIGNRPISNVALVGPSDRLYIDESVRLDPYTVLDTTNGPITIEAGVIVQPFTRIEGPCHIGRDTQLFRANLRGGVTLGPNCRIGGEVEQSIVHGQSNKYHEGFLGHAYIGEWVNLGAITSNSDLRNDYGEVFVPLGGDPVATGQAKVGCFVGDHTRTGLGSMLNTGTAIGVMCNVLPAGLLLPKHIPSFTAVLYGRVAPGFALDELFNTAKIVMGRRNQVFSDVDCQLYLDLHEQTRLERERAFQKNNDRRNDTWPVVAASRRS